MLQGELDGLCAGGGLGDHFDLRASQHALQSAADHFMVVGDQ